MTRAAPWTFHLHPVSLVVATILAVLYPLAIRHPGWQATRRQIACFVGAFLLLLVCTSWPMADLASQWSLTCLVLQRLSFTLALPPLLLLGVPTPVVAALTRPARIDAAVRRCTRPAVAVAIVTVVAVGTLTSGAVDLQSSSSLARGFFDLLLLAAGFVLWAPVLHPVPGTDRPTVMGKAGYLMIQSIVPSFLAVVWIFARHPLYPAYAHAQVLGIMPVTDQQIAGFVAKFGTIVVLWSVAFVLLMRAERAEQHGGDIEPLTWADVERQLERLERSERRLERAKHQGGQGPPG